jgi:hypothetical protein
MKKILTILFFYVAGLAPCTAIFAQGKIPQDTIFYLLDTAKTPPSDRMWSIENAPPHQFYTIKCPCLKSGRSPIFRGNKSKLTNINLADVKKLKLINLADLIQFVRQQDDVELETKIKLFFIVVKDENYLKQQVFFLGSKETKIQ